MCGYKEKFVEFEEKEKRNLSFLVILPTRSNSNLIVKVFISRNKIFISNNKTNESKYLEATIKNEVWCWHMRYRHLNDREFKTLGNEMMKGMPHINHPNQLCKACLLGKHARRNFSKEAKSRKKSLNLQLVHIDVYGPI
ncbi:hypothetical protein CR513_52243, partial [Mucuna pruriens]